VHNWVIKYYNIKSKEGKHSMDFLYVSRRNVDFEYNKPLLENSNCVVLNIGSDDLSKRVFNKNVYILPKSIKLLQSCVRILKRLSKFKLSSSFFIYFEEAIYKKIGNHILSLTKINNCDRVVFDHNSSRQYQIFFTLLKSEKLMIYSIPHADYVFSNTLLDNHNIHTIKPDQYGVLDRVIVTSEAQRKSVVGNTNLLKSIRYSEYWTRKQVSNLPVLKEKREITVLVLQSLSVGGVCNIQFHRTLKFLNTLGIQVIIRPHPTKGIKEIRDIKSLKHVSLSNSSLTCDILNASIVVHFQSSGFLDAVNLKKKIIFAQFASSNTLHTDYLKGVIICHNFDEFRETLLRFLGEPILTSHAPLRNQADIEKDFFVNLKTWHQALDIKCLSK